MGQQIASAPWETAGATWLMAVVLGTNSLTWAEAGVLVVFAVSFGWIALSFWAAAAGFVLALGGATALIQITARALAVWASHEALTSLFRSAQALATIDCRSAEHDVSRVTAVAVARALDPERYDVVPVAITTYGRWLLADEAVAQLEGARDALPAA